MFEMLDLETIFTKPSVWLMIFLLIVVFWLVRVITDHRQEVSVVKESSAHMVTPAFLAQFTALNNKQQLKRIRDAYRRAAAKDGSGRFDLELQREINLIKGGASKPPNPNDPEAAFYDSDDDNEPTSRRQKDNDHLDFQDQ
jgi:hypothetical protein